MIQIHWSNIPKPTNKTMIETHLPDAEAKYSKFISQLKENNYFPSDEKSELYESLEKKAKETFIEETTKALATQYKDMANKKFKTGNFKAAIELYTESIRLFPSAIPLNNRGKAYEMTGFMDNALEDYLTATKVDKTYPKPYIGAIEINMKNKEKSKAEEIFEEMKKNIQDQKMIAAAKKFII